MNQGCSKSYNCLVAIAAFILCKFGVTEGSVVPATGSTSPFAGVSDAIGADGTNVKRVDVYKSGILTVLYGGEVKQGDPLTSDSQGRAIKATPVAGTAVYIAGFAESSGSLGDYGDMFVAPGCLVNSELVVVAEKTLTAVQIKTLNATPIEVIPAPGAGKAIVLLGCEAFLDFGTVAYGGIADGEDINLKYTDANGTALAKIETTGFMDAIADAVRVAAPLVPISTTNLAPVANAAVVAHMTTGEIITGDSVLKIRARYRIIDTAW